MVIEVVSDNNNDISMTSNEVVGINQKNRKKTSKEKSSVVKENQDHGKKISATEKSKGLNYSAIVFLLMMILPAIVTISANVRTFKRLFS